MNLFFIKVVFFTTLFFSLSLQSEEIKQSLVGVGSYALNVSNDLVEQDDELSGFGVSSVYSLTDNFSVRAEYYMLEHKDFSNVDATGFGVVALVGTGMATEGFKIFAGAGLFSETWESSSFDEDFSGWQVSGGIGYNWSILAIDLILNVRDASDYEGLLERANGISTKAAASASLMLYARF